MSDRESESEYPLVFQHRLEKPFWAEPLSIPLSCAWAHMVERSRCPRTGFCLEDTLQELTARSPAAEGPAAARLERGEEKPPHHRHHGDVRSSAPAVSLCRSAPIYPPAKAAAAQPLANCVLSPMTSISCICSFCSSLSHKIRQRGCC